MAIFGRRKPNSDGPDARASAALPGPALAEPDRGEAQAVENALTCVRMFSDWGLPLDFSPASLENVERVVADWHDDFAETGVLPPANAVGLVGFYLLEVARKQFGGIYLYGRDDDDPIVLRIGDERSSVVLFARSKVLGRIRNGPEDSLPFYYDGIAPALTRPGATELH